MNGHSPLPWKDIAPIFAGLVSDLAGQGFAGPFAVADGRVIHAAGGSEAQELAFALASAVAYLRALEQSGIALDDARRFIYFRLAADQDQFLTIAKFRAVRKLWARVEEACGLKPLPVFVAAETAWRMMTKRDPHGNIVRGTIAALGAAVGGADAVTVLPFSAALGVPDAFARRIARNTQTILIEEANIHRVADPAAGSGAIEALTDALCDDGLVALARRSSARAAWPKPCRPDRSRRVVAEVRAEREANVARRKDTLVGTSDFPDLAEDKVAVLAQSRLAALSSNAAALGRRSDWQSRSSACATAAMPISPSMAQGPRCSSPVSAAPPISTRGRASPRACSSPAASKRWKEKATTSRNDSRNRGRSSPASAPPTRSMSARPKTWRRRWPKRARRASTSRASPRDRAALERAGISSFLHQGCDTLANSERRL